MQSVIVFPSQGYQGHCLQSSVIIQFGKGDEILYSIRSAPGGSTTVPFPKWENPSPESLHSKLSM